MGALHQIDSAALRSAASAWHDEFAPLPKPLLVVNLGGPTRKPLIILGSFIFVVFHLPIILLLYFNKYFCCCSVRSLHMLYFNINFMLG